jgi:hypothetical protein
MVVALPQLGRGARRPRRGHELESEPRFDCIVCGERIAAPLARLGSTCCHECRLAHPQSTVWR